ncbi:MAG: RluA family pseudouridine synthase [Desulfobacterales bacterium]|nr:RluA family pseudouridine synthase [Desulfobacterales bacterium]
MINKQTCCTGLATRAYCTLLQPFLSLMKLPTIPILWSDEHLIVVNKPSGIPVLPDRYDPTIPCLWHQLKETYQYIWVVHRLDKETSGILIFARTKESHQLLNIQFQNRETLKTYHVLSVSVPNWKTKTVTLPLRPNGDRRHRTVVDTNHGKSAVTHFNLLQTWKKGYALLEAVPETGRTHQIRIHLASQGISIIGDILYGNGQFIYLSSLKPNYTVTHTQEKPLISRLGLHAFRLIFRHPNTGAMMTCEAPYPKDFSRVMYQLNKHACGTN